MSEQPDESAALADRLGLCAAEPDDDVRLGDVPLTLLRRAEVRRRIVVSDTAAMLFSGRLADRLDVTGTGGVDRALDTASAADILEALPEGLETLVAERGRTFSGGQRQRLVLARALAGDPEILVLVEPTSAVDAHTEARIAARLRRHRAGRTTVVTTSSPLMLDAVDEVAFLRDGRVVATGPHGDLLTDNPEYRRGRHPRDRPRGGGRMSTSTSTSTSTVSTSCRSPTPARSAATPSPMARKHPRLLWSAVALHVLAALAAPRRAAAARRPRPGRRGRHHGRPRRPDHAGPGRVPRRADRADPLRPLRQPGARRAGAGRAARGLRRERARAPGRRRRVGRLRRPADPHQPRRRPARLVGADGAARVDDRGDHRDPHVRRRDQRRLVGRAAVPARRAPAGDRAAVVPRPRQGRLPARERVVLRDQRDAHRDRRGRPHRRGARPRRGADRARSTTTSRVLRAPSATRCSCARCSSRAWRSPT